MRPIVLFVAVIGMAACSASTPATTTGSQPVSRRAPGARDTVMVRDPELERRIARLELQLIERDAQIDELSARLTDTRDEVVRTMAKLQSATSRAEAASGVAEADVALRALRSTAGASRLPELAQVAALVRRSSEEFDRQNFGGALYLATQARAEANAARARLTGGASSAPRAGETPFAVPLRLKALGRGNVREGPGTNFPVLFSVNSGSILTAASYAEDWIRVSDEGGRSGWIFRSLVGRP